MKSLARSALLAAVSWKNMKIFLLIVCLNLCSTGTSNTHGAQPADVADILQAIIDAPQLQEYYHVGEVSGRAPLVVVSDDIPKDTKLQKFGLPVVVCTTDNAAKLRIAAHLKIDSMTFNGTSARVVFSYPVEGVYGAIELHRARRWEIVTTNIAEH